MKGLPPYAWEPEKPALVGVMRRDAGAATIRWFETAPCYVFHPMNGWDDGDRITAEVMQYAVAPLFPNADGSPGAPAQAHLTRWTIDLKDVTNTVRAETLDDLSGEFPRLDERRTGLSYRHGYFAAHSRRDDRVAFNMIAHIDLKTGARRTYAFGAADGVSEPVFTPRGPNEGEGWLLAVVFRGAENRSDLVVLDAEDVAAGPVAVAAVPRRVPYGFHGNWRPA
jgi:carotenoid cleavage dioxygenase